MLERLRVPFKTACPNIDEAPRRGEQIEALVERLALEKAREIATRFPDSVVIGCDQMARFGDHAVGKPLTRQRAMEQLLSFSGRQVEFLSAVCVFAPSLNIKAQETVSTCVIFRELSEDEIERYVDADQPLGCAGSFKSESLGITLLESMSSADPTSIIGLPLIALSRMLRQCGFRVP